MINKSRKAELKRTHLTKVAMPEATNCMAAIFAIWCELFKFIAMTFEFAQLCTGMAISVCVCVLDFFYSLYFFSLPNVIWQWDKFSRWQNGSAFSDGSIKSINFYWTFVFQVCPVQCSGKSHNRSFTLPLYSARNKSSRKKCPMIVCVCVCVKRAARKIDEKYKRRLHF